MKIKHLILIGLSCTLLLRACEKEDNFDFPITLYAHEISQVSSVRLFTNGKEIYNSDVINNFVKNYKYFKLPTAADIKSSNSSICFLSMDSAIFESGDSGFTIKKTNIQFLFYSPLSVLVSEGDFLESLMKYTGELHPIPSNTGYDYITNEVRVGYGTYKNLEICFLSYLLLKKDNGLLLSNGMLFNEFNEEAEKTIESQYTLAIQEYRIRYIAK